MFSSGLQPLAVPPVPSLPSTCLRVISSHEDRHHIAFTDTPLQCDCTLNADVHSDSLATEGYILGFPKGELVNPCPGLVQAQETGEDSKGEPGKLKTQPQPSGAQLGPSRTHCAYNVTQLA